MLTPEQFYVLREHGTERAGTSPLDKTYAPARMTAPAAICRCSPRRRSSTAAPAGRASSSRSTTRSAHRRQELLHDAHGSALPPLRRSPRPRVRGRPTADGSALLHERRRLEVRPQGDGLSDSTDEEQPFTMTASSSDAIHGGAAARLGPRHQARRARALLSARDPRVPWYAKAVALAVAAYALSPIDLIPDFIPVLGYLDDVILVPLGILLAVRLIPPDDLRRASRHGHVRPERQASRAAAVVIIAIWIGLALVAARRRRPLFRLSPPTSPGGTPCNTLPSPLRIAA